jgi:lysophospholipase L1-like esterase
MQSFYPGILGSRGFFFPYKIAKTNSPGNLSIQYTGEWITSKNTQPNPEFIMGLSGMTSQLSSQTGSLQIIARFDSAHTYDFNRLRIFCNISDLQHAPRIEPEGIVVQTFIDKAGAYVQYNLSGYIDTLKFTIYQDSASLPFQLYGISLENDDPGVTYNTIGVNGAMLKSYLRCELFKQQLKALEPDWVILSMGTNEGNTFQFDEPAYRNAYLRLLDTIRSVAPEAAILLTVPNDSYLRKKYINRNTERMRQIIFDIARSGNYGVWDFYTIMGGLNSVKTWYSNGLMSADHIHFNKTGYLLKGDLFFDAFQNTWNDPSFNHRSADFMIPNEQAGNRLPENIPSSESEISISVQRSMVIIHPEVNRKP